MTDLPDDDDRGQGFDHALVQATKYARILRGYVEGRNPCATRLLEMFTSEPDGIFELASMVEYCSDTGDPKTVLETLDVLRRTLLIRDDGCGMRASMLLKKMFEERAIKIIE
jgi:hypothetical protein